MVFPRTKFRLEQFPGSLSPKWNKEETEIRREKEKAENLKDSNQETGLSYLLRIQEV